MSDVAAATKFDIPDPNQRMTEAVFYIPDEVFETLTEQEAYERVVVLSDYEMGALHFEKEEAVWEILDVLEARWAGRAIKEYFTPAKRERLKWVEDYMNELRTPPPETELPNRDNPSPEELLERFCRVRHQIHLKCSECEVTSRHVVRWTPDEGFVYPPLQCTTERCGSHNVTQYAETYIEQTPRPDAFDPEPERTRAWHESVHESPRVAVWELFEEWEPFEVWEHRF